MITVKTNVFCGSLHKDGGVEKKIEIGDKTANWDKKKLCTINLGCRQ